MDKITELKEIIENSRRLVFFGGAGVSTESGIPDFRSTDGLYNQKYDYPPETILSHDFFVSKTEEFYRFYKEKMICPSAKPNDAHKVLAQLENRGILTAVVTQNIDGLHTLAGSRNVMELHGSVHRNFCLRCGKKFDAEYILKSDGVPKCACGGTVKPDVVLYGEPLDDETVDRAIRAISSADTVIVGGTSLGVYPAAGLLSFFRGNKIVLINKTPTQLDGDADLIIRDPIGQTLRNCVGLSEQKGS